jgi:hypothetical protein
VNAVTIVRDRNALVSMTLCRATRCANSLIMGLSTADMIAMAADSVAKRENSYGDARCATMIPASTLRALAPCERLHARRAFIGSVFLDALGGYAATTVCFNTKTARGAREVV